MGRYDDGWSRYLQQYITAPSVQLLMFVVVVIFLLGFSWYINMESMLEDMMDQFRRLLLLFPLILLILLHCLSSSSSSLSNILLPNNPDQQDSIHRAGGSPWGVALLLVFLLFMISYHSSIRHSWWPLLS